MKKNKIIISKALLFVMPPLLIIGILFIYLYQNNLDKNRVITQTIAKSHVRLIKKNIVNDLKNVISDLRFLLDLQKEYLSRTGKNENNKSSLDREYQSFSKHRSLYDQIRFLDLNGIEKMRINFNLGHPQIIRKKALKSKKTRYYFKEANRLSFEEIYISRFDLNSELGKIEIPLKPTIRFVAPVYDSKNKKKGLMILNYLGAKLLDNLPEKTSDYSSFDMLINSDGYWLKNHNPKNEWGFMFKERAKIQFQKKYPSEWKHIQKTSSGQFISEEGLFTFTTINLYKDSITTNNYKNTLIQTNRSTKPWKLVSYTPLEILNNKSQSFLFNLIQIYILMLIVLGTGTSIISIIIQKRKESDMVIKQQQAAYSQFIPVEFLQILKQDNILNVNLGDAVQKNLTILFCDIRSFTKLSESMSSDEILEFLNSYFSQITNPISNNQGFIDKFIGDSVMALFPKHPEAAIKAAIGMYHQLASYNVARKDAGCEPVRVGIGLHCGLITLGTVGSLKRMDTTVIGDDVNLASRVESLTKIFNVNIIITSNVYETLPESNKYYLREIDSVRVKGKNIPVVLYELFDVDDPKVIEGKLKSQGLFKKALSFYKAGEFSESFEFFKECLDICPEDTIPPIYIKRCNTLMRVPPGPGWTGISTL